MCVHSGFVVVRDADSNARPCYEEYKVKSIRSYLSVVFAPVCNPSRLYLFKHAWGALCPSEVHDILPGQI